MVLLLENFDDEEDVVDFSFFDCEYFNFWEDEEDSDLFFEMEFMYYLRYEFFNWVYYVCKVEELFLLEERVDSSLWFQLMIEFDVFLFKIDFFFVW